MMLAGFTSRLFVFSCLSSCSAFGCLALGLPNSYIVARRDAPRMLLQNRRVPQDTKSVFFAAMDNAFKDFEKPVVSQRRVHLGDILQDGYRLG